MAASKEKLLESAQKSLKKKQIAKAIKDYAKVVDIDPADVRSRQKLAELYVRSNKAAEAYEQYESVAKYFASNGFYLKAIAIYKLMQRLDPGQVSLFNRLAELYEKQGLLGNAMAEYRNLTEYYARNGMIADEIRTLEKMSGLDGNNLNIKVKLAETYAKNERADDGYDLLEEVLEALGNKADFDKILRLYKMFLPLYPNNEKLQMGLALALYEKGEFTKGVTILENLQKERPNEPDLLRLIGRGYADAENHDRAQDIFLRLLELDPTDLDVRESLFKTQMARGHFHDLLEGLEEWKDTFGKAGRLESLKYYYETLKTRMPKEKKVLQTLDSIYSLTGEGDKVLDILSEREEEPVVVVEETISDSLLGIIDDTAQDVVEDEVLDLELESLELVDHAPGEEATIELNLNDDVESEASLELDFDFDLSDGADENPAEERHDLRADLEEAEFYLQQGLFDDARTAYEKILAYAPDSAECRQKLEELNALAEEAGGKSAPEVESADPFSLSDAFSDLDFDSSFDIPDKDSRSKKVFRTDVDEQIAADDMESHYNLGIAYREMGLYEDAITEFDKALKDPSRYADCMTLKGLCYSDTEDYDNAEMIFQQALDSALLDDIQRLNLGYELGLLYERAGRPGDALTSYRTVLKQDVNYRDVADKVSSLERQLGVEEQSVMPSDEGGGRISFL